MKFKFSSTFFLVLALIGFSLWYFVYEKQIKTEKGEKERKDKLLFSWPASEIQELEIYHSSGESFKLKKTGPDWLLTSPVEDEADSSVVNSLVNQLTSASEEREVETTPTNLEMYGLDQPALIIKAYKDVNTFIQLSIGSQTQVGFGAYARLSDKPQVLKIGRTLLSAFQKSLFELRRKTLVRTPQTNLKELEIWNPTGKFFLFKNSENQWVIGRESLPTDATQLTKFLNTLTDLKATGVVSEKADIASFGLTTPQIKLILSSTADTPKETILITQKGGKVYGKNENKPLIYELDKTVLKELGLNENELRELHIASFNRFVVHKIKITRQDSETEFIKNGTTWSFSDPKADETVDPNAIEAFLTQLQDSKLANFDANQKLEKPTLSIELFERKEDKDISIAKIELLKSSPHQVRGKSTTLPKVWLISNDTFKGLDRLRKDFLEPQDKQPEE